MKQIPLHNIFTQRSFFVTVDTHQKIRESELFFEGNVSQSMSQRPKYSTTQSLIIFRGPL